jgi:hypothetical protein
VIDGLIPALKARDKNAYSGRGNLSEASIPDGMHFHGRTEITFRAPMAFHTR